MVALGGGRVWKQKVLTQGQSTRLIRRSTEQTFQWQSDAPGRIQNKKENRGEQDDAWGEMEEGGG